MKTGMNPLLSATLGGHVETVIILLAAGFDANQCDNSGRCALNMARTNLAQCHAAEKMVERPTEEAKKKKKKKLEAAENMLLWQKMVGILCKDTSVHRAAMEGNLERLRYLERCQSETGRQRCKTSSGRRGSREQRSYWLSKPNKYGCTPLHLAIMHGQVEAAKWIDRRVDQSAWRAMNRVNQTPDDLCVTAPRGSDMLMALAESRR
jgi:hypothetical protein